MEDLSVVLLSLYCLYLAVVSATVRTGAVQRSPAQFLLLYDLRLWQTPLVAVDVNGVHVYL